MKKLRWYTALMLLVILVLAGFQVYWLRDNYHREARALEERTTILFRETGDQLRDSLIRQRLKSAIGDTVLWSGISHPSGTPHYAENIVTDAIKAARVMGDMQTLRIGQTDTIKQARSGNGKIFVSLNTQLTDSIGSISHPDSVSTGDIKEITLIRPSRPQGRPVIRVRDSPERTQVLRRDSASGNFFQTGTFVLTDKDGKRVMLSLDTIVSDTIPESLLEASFARVLKSKNTEVPFTLVKAKDAPPGNFRPGFSLARTGSGYSVKLGNTFPYLIKQISLPVLFSVFLVGITVFSFLLLYRSLRRQRHLAVMKNDLISNITHELKTPIATVGVAIEALKNFNAIQDPARTREYLDISQNELHRLELLVDKGLKLSMFENKDIELNYQQCDLGEMVKDVIASLRLQAEKQQARISLDVSGDAVLQGDKLHLMSVVFNLLDNALKYSRDNASIQVMIEEKDKQVELRVKDNGIGIPGQYKDKVFEKFFRVPAGNTHNAKGHGLGLSYVAKVIQQHGGSITLDSYEGLGSTFTIILPKQQS
ncbi:MAG TPA: HAMP domain-containing sensor histidine kinase [Chitinophagaceae bacterium]|nr:HAMP domain-containing sensor histidine kinase [Chitinophagaceae bacterium]